jgi:prepilin-type N-terminal cleavage/methylation domain-containing protein
MKNNKQKYGFTLIELLMVIAIIGILAGILIPTVGAVRKQANVAASKAQLSQYVNAIQLFKGEYSYFPFTSAQADGGATIPSITEAKFIGALSARKVNGDKITSSTDVALDGNRRLIGFHSFSESEFLEGDASTGEIADRFDNTNIYIAIDGTGNGKLTGLPAPSGSGTQELRANVTAYTLNDSSTEDQTLEYYLYD